MHPPSAVSKSGTTDPAVVLTGVTKIFRLPFQRAPLVAVRDLNLRVAPGEIYGLLGPNGSGKSTVLKIILGLLTPTRGQAQIFGQESDLAASRASVGFLPESPYFYKFLTGAETLRFYGKLCGLHGPRLKTRINELLELVGLTDAGPLRLAGYSKGMLQRIGLAQALIHRPALLVLDEPTAGVDPAGAREICDLILELKSSGATVLVSSHLLGQAEEICDRIGILARGVLVREGVVSALLGVQTQTQLILENASPRLVDEIDLLASQAGAKLIERCRPRTSLERVFLEATQAPGKQTGPPAP